MCNDPQDVGRCREDIRKVYYDAYQRRCLEFAYGGCEGSGNRFSSIEECESICVTREERQPTGNDTDLTHKGKINFNKILQFHHYLK